MISVASFKAEDTKPSEPLLGDIECLTMPTESDLYDSEEEKEEEPCPLKSQASMFTLNHPNLAREFHPDHIFGKLYDYYMERDSEKWKVQIKDRDFK